MGRDLASLWSDAAGAGMVVALVGLPPVSLALALRGRRLTLAAFLSSATLWVLWFLYYAIELFGNLGLAGLHLALLWTALGWGLLALSLIAPWRRGPFPELLDLRPLFRRE